MRKKNESTSIRIQVISILVTQIVILLFLLVSSGISVQMVTRHINEQQRSLQTLNQKMGAIQGVERLVLKEVALTERQFADSGKPQVSEETLAARREATTSLLREFSVLGTSLGDAGAPLAKRFLSSHQELQKIMEQTAVNEPIANAQLLPLRDRMQELANVCISHLDDMRAKVGSENSPSSRSIQSSVAFFYWTTAGVSFLASFALLLMGYFRVSRSTQTLISSLASLSSNADAFSKELQTIRNEVEQLSSSSGTQTTAVHETGTVIADMNLEVSNLARSIQLAEENGQSILTETEEGVGMMDNVVTEMRSVEELGHKLDVVSSIIQGISRKTDVIHEIVSTTKLLSLNASIEAARAGDYGRGFAIVAEEVGNLAQMSDGAAREISSLIASSRKEVDDITTEAMQRVKATLSATSGVSEHLDKISSNVRSVSDELRSISSVAQQIESGLVRSTAAMERFRTSTSSGIQLGQQIVQSATHIQSMLNTMQGNIKQTLTLLKGSTDYAET